MTDSTEKTTETGGLADLETSDEGYVASGLLSGEPSVYTIAIRERLQPFHLTLTKSGYICGAIAEALLAPSFAGPIAAGSRAEKPEIVTRLDEYGVYAGNSGGRDFVPKIRKSSPCLVALPLALVALVARLWDGNTDTFAGSVQTLKRKAIGAGADPTADFGISVVSAMEPGKDAWTPYYVLRKRLIEEGWTDAQIVPSLRLMVDGDDDTAPVLEKRTEGKVSLWRLI